MPTLAFVQDKTRQANALFGVLYSPMYIDFIQIIFCAGPNEASWLNSFLTQHQLPFSVKLVTLDVDQGVGRGHEDKRQRGMEFVDEIFIQIFPNSNWNRNGRRKTTT